MRIRDRNDLAAMGGMFLSVSLRRDRVARISGLCFFERNMRMCGEATPAPREVDCMSGRRVAAEVCTVDSEGFVWLTGWDGDGKLQVVSACFSGYGNGTLLYTLWRKRAGPDRSGFPSYTDMFT